jgi:zinc protease
MNRTAAARFAGQMLMRGTAKRTRQQLRDEIDKLKAQLSVGGSATSASVTIQTTRQNLPAVLSLAAEILREPSFPAEEFELAKQAAITQAESQRSEPTAKAIEEMNKHFNRYPKGDVRYMATIDENIADLKAVTLDEAKKFYRDFYGASTGEIAIVGDFDPKETQAQLARLFGDWKSPSKFTRVPSQYFDVARANLSVETPDKANAFFLASLNLKLRDDNPDYAALTLGNYLFGGGFLNSRFLSRIRQKDGISYGGASWLSANSLDESGTFSAYAIYAPQNAEKVEKGFREELDRVLKEGFTAQELEDAKKGYLQELRQARTEDFSLATTLRNDLFLNRTKAFDEAFEKQIAALTIEQVNAAFRKYVTPDKISIVKAGDFAKAKAAAPKQ